MPKTHKNPAYRMHKPTSQAVVTLGGKDFYLGRHGTSVSRQEYDRLISEWLANGRRLPTRNDSDITINELFAGYLNFAKGYYLKNGKHTGEYNKIISIMRIVKSMYDKTPVSEFGPLSLKAIRQKMLTDGYLRFKKKCCYSRNFINESMRRIKRIISWGVENELVPTNVLQALQAVSGLRKGRTKAHDNIPIKPVPDEYVDAIKEHVLPQVWAIVELQRLTGMRSGEVVIMRRSDIDTSGQVWLYRPSIHKTEHHDHERSIDLGPLAQKIIIRFLKSDINAFLFSPRDAIVEQYKNATVRRRPDQKPNPKKTKRRVGDSYTTESYRQAVVRACGKAKVPQWFPHQLRHSAGTRFRRTYGLEVARILLGHRSAGITELYAEADRSKAREAMLKIG